MGAEDGGRFLADLLRAKCLLIVAGHLPNLQHKRFREAFAAQGMDLGQAIISPDVPGTPSDDAVATLLVAVR